MSKRNIFKLLKEFYGGNDEDSFTRFFRIFTTAFFLLIILVIISILTGEFRSGCSGAWHYHIPTVFLVLLLMLIPLIIRKLKNTFIWLLVLTKTFFNKSMTPENIANAERILDLKLQESVLGYYGKLREQFKDEELISRIIERKFIFGDDINHIASSFFLPDLIDKSPMYFSTKVKLYYYPYYEKRILSNFFKIRFLYKFEFISDKLVKWYYSDIEQNAR